MQSIKKILPSIYQTLKDQSILVLITILIILSIQIIRLNKDSKTVQKYLTHPKISSTKTPRIYNEGYKQ